MIMSTKTILPATSDWVAAVAKDTNKTYYYHKKTREVRWTLPTGEDCWYSAIDKRSGKTYYYNKKTSSVSWTKPKGQLVYNNDVQSSGSWNLKQVDTKHALGAQGKSQIPSKLMEQKKLALKPVDIVIICTHCSTPNKIRLPKGNEKWATITTKCGGCDKQFETRNPNFGKADKSDHTEKIQCKYCNIPPLPKEKLDQHIRRRHEFTGPFFCKNCAGKFRFLALFRKHRCKQWECPVCDLVFVFEDVFSEHMALHGEKPFVCSLCERAFKGKSGLKAHYRTHLSESDKEFQCDKCPKRFFTRASLTHHVREHTGEKPEVCCVCKEGFVSRTKMVTHQRKCFNVHKQPNQRLVKRRVGKKMLWLILDDTKRSGSKRKRYEDKTLDMEEEDQSDIDKDIDIAIAEM